MRIQRQSSFLRRLRTLADGHWSAVLPRQTQRLAVRGFQIAEGDRQETAQKQFFRFAAEPLVRIERAVGHDKPPEPFFPVRFQIFQDMTFKQRIAVGFRVADQVGQPELQPPVANRARTRAEIEQQLRPLFVNHPSITVGCGGCGRDYIFECGKNSVRGERIRGGKASEAGTAKIPLFGCGTADERGEKPVVRHTRLILRSESETRKAAPADKEIKTVCIIRPCVEARGKGDFPAVPALADESERPFSIGRRDMERAENFRLQTVGSPRKRRTDSGPEAQGKGLGMIRIPRNAHISAADEPERPLLGKSRQRSNQNH